MTDVTRPAPSQEGPGEKTFGDGGQGGHQPGTNLPLPGTPSTPGIRYRLDRHWERLAIALGKLGRDEPLTDAETYLVAEVSEGITPQFIVRTMKEAAAGARRASVRANIMMGLAKLTGHPSLSSDHQPAVNVAVGVRVDAGVAKATEEELVRTAMEDAEFKAKLLAALDRAHAAGAGRNGDGAAKP